jgi:hypothetical protein
MDGATRRTLEMGRRAQAFAAAHPEQIPGSLPALSRLKEILTRADELMIQHRDGISEVRAATAEKREIRRKIRRSHLPHFARVAHAAGAERPELAEKLLMPPEGMPYLVFRSAVQGILTEAEKEKELLLKYGLVDPAPSSLGAVLGQFDRAVERSDTGRRAHVGARAELTAIANEVMEQVRQLDGLIRFRFANDPEAMAAWGSARNIIGPPRSGGGEAPPAGGAVKPAA